MKKNVVAYLAGLLFGIGLFVAGMTDPRKVIGFLDFFGDWDPSLALVMVGAIGVYSVAWRVITRRAAPLYDTTFHLPQMSAIDARLVGGAAIFGVGWGLSGLCPGPAIVNAGGGSLGALVFVVAMGAGMFVLAFPNADHARTTASAGSGGAG